MEFKEEKGSNVLIVEVVHNTTNTKHTVLMPINVLLINLQL